MTVYIEKPAVNLREELASLRNQGGYQEQQFYFDNFVTNGTFDADTNWTKGTGWTISGGTANAAGGTSDGQYFEQNIGIVKGKNYYLSYDAGGTMGGVNYFNVRIGGTVDDLTDISAGTFSGHFLASGSGNLRFRSEASSENLTIDNVTVYESDGTDVIHRMPKGWVPKDVFIDGLLQREGAANDYEVVYDGFDYSVKPTVAPSATTQTCVIGVRK